MNDLQLKIELLKKINEVKQLGKQLGYPNILYNEQYKELELSINLGHQYNEGQGEDATMEAENCEYKTMVGYKGSFQYHWISKEKLDKLKNTPHHYFGVYGKESAELEVIYYLPVSSIISEIEAVYLEAERKRQILMESGKKKSKNIDAHKSFTVGKIKKLGAQVVFGQEPIKS